MRVRIGLVVLLLAFLAACTGRSPEATSEETAASGSPAAAALPAPEPVSVNGMPNTVLIGDLLFGGQPEPETLEDLAHRGYKTVLTTRGEGENKWDEKDLVESLGMAYASIPMAYPIESITDAQVAEFDALMQNAARPMVVHCSSGNRVAGLWTVWLVEHQGLDPAKALELGDRLGMTRIRPVVEKRLGGGR